MTEAMATMSLSDCSAVVISSTDGGIAALTRFAEAAGFGAAVDFRKASTANTHLMPFYIMDNSVPDAGKLRFMKMLRSSSEPVKQYAPILLCLPKGPLHQAVFFIEMGFDDVIFLSDEIDKIAEQLRQQIGHEIPFVQTESYLGPDRRRIERVSRGDPRRKKGGSTHRRLMVTRDPINGPRVVERY